MEYRVLNLGDRALTFEFGSVISKSVNHHVLGVHAHLKERIAQGVAPGLIESVPTFRSLTIHFDPLLLYPEDVEELVAPYIAAEQADLSAATCWSFPVCYEEEYAPDLEDVARQSGLTTAEVVKRHLAQTYDVFMLGFLPGFAFMGLLDELLRMPRKATPRTAVPQGSVAIADQLTAVYPSVSPGGWNLIGQTPIRFFAAQNDGFALLKPGDKVAFHKVGASEFSKISAAIHCGEYATHEQCQLKGQA